MTIQSFSDKATEEFFTGGRTKKKVGWASIRKVAKRRLDMLHYAATIKDLEMPPGNKLEALKGALKGYHSVRINDQWRIVFKWSDSGPQNVRIEDYH
ncbi:type II toxin-antitoxin system RelE/ParE family toxin [Bdellovibrionota bacterium]